jgi:hypothetical protein
MFGTEGFGSGTEIQGSVLLSLQTVLGDCGQHIFYSRGLGFIDSADWYPQSVMLDILQAASESCDAWISNLVLVGMAVADKAISSRLSSQSYSPCTVLYTMSRMYDQTHRGADSGKMTLIIADSHLELIARTAYPCDFAYGVLHQLVHHSRGSAGVWHDDRMPCRKRGYDACEFHIV